MIRRQASPFWTNVARVAALITICTLLFKTYQYYFSSPVKTLQLTVRVHEEGDRSKFITEGEVIVDIGHSKEYKPIATDGEVDFEEIGDKFIDKDLPIYFKSEKYEAVEPNKTYKFSGDPVYFTVKLKPTLGLIKGIVKNEKEAEFLDSVLILIENEFTIFTDSLGRFSFEMPNNRYKEKYSLTFRKDGYNQSTEDYYPNSSREFRLKKK